MREISYAVYEYPFCRLKIGCTDEAVQYVLFTDEAAGGARTPLSDRADAQLREYFAGTRREFDLPLAPEGTAFRKQVWAALLEIPYGETRSYREIAERIGSPKAVRAVGGANHHNPISILIPCHRVVGAGGGLTGYAGGLETKAQLLALEGARG